MNIAFVFGKGIDGCGVSRGAKIFEQYLYENGHTVVIIDFNNGNLYLRSTLIKWQSKVITVGDEDVNVADDIIDLLNLQDIIIIHSYPIAKFGHIDRFRECIEKITKPIIVAYDHGISTVTINSSLQMGEIFAMSDYGIVQSLSGQSYKAFKKFVPNLKLVENKIWIDCKKFNHWRNPVNQRKRELVYMGRMSPLKDPALIPRMYRYIPGWELTLTGCEYSISSVCDYTGKWKTNTAPYSHWYNNLIIRTRRRVNGQIHILNTSKGTKISALDAYDYNVGMEILGKSKFSWCGYMLSDAREYGTRMEYTQIESFLLTLPIISKHFANNAMSPEDKFWSEYDGPLVFESELQLAKQLINMSDDEWTYRTNECINIVTRLFDYNHLCKVFLDDVLKTGKRKKSNHLSIYFPEALDYRSRGEVVITTPSVINSKLLRILKNKKQVTIVPPGDIEGL